MRISDWSSDVCSSDLDKIGAKVREPERASTPYSAAAARDDSNLAGQIDPGLGHEVGSPVSGRNAGSGPKPCGGWGSSQRSGASTVRLAKSQPTAVRTISS